MINIRARTFIFVTLALIICSCDQLNIVRLNRAAIESMQKENPRLAEQQLMESMALQPNNPVLNLNLGFNFEMAKNFNKAVNEYQSVQKNSRATAEEQFVSMFNAGNANVGDKKTDVALKAYQTALDIAKTHSLDSEWVRETKNNIELITQGGGQGGGGGEGDPKDKDDSKGDQPQQQPKQGQDPQEQPQEQKNNFKSEKLTQEDVRKILEELKSQEKKIRAQEQDGKTSDANPGKDW